MIFVAEILAHASRVFELPIADIKAGCRRRQFVRARQAVCYLARELTRQSYPLIASRVGLADHSTVVHSWHTCKANMARDKAYAGQVRLVRRMAVRKLPMRPHGGFSDGDIVFEQRQRERGHRRTRGERNAYAREYYRRYRREAMDERERREEEEARALEAWAARSDEELLSEAVQSFYAAGGSCVEARS